MWFVIICGFVCGLVVFRYHDRIKALEYTKKMIQWDIQELDKRYQRLFTRHMALLKYLNIEYCEREVRDESYMSGCYLKPTFHKIKGRKQIK